MTKVLKIKRSLTLNLEGGVSADTPVATLQCSMVGLTPDDFPGMVPKLEVKPGDTVKAGQALWYDKADESIKVVSPVGGTVVDVVRGEKRKLLYVTVRCDATLPSVVPALTNTSDATAIKALMKSEGLWGLMRQLPYDIVPVDNRKPVNIFVSAWDAAPLAGSYAHYLTAANLKCLQTGINALCKLTLGNVVVGFKAGTDFPQLENAVTVAVDGGYPASLPSVLAANTYPVNKGETVWLLGVEIAVMLGQALSGMAIDRTFPVSVVGSEVARPCVVKAPQGASVEELIAIARVKNTECHKRYIGGNVFVGFKVEPDGYLRAGYRQLTVIPEGDDKSEFMGWASISPSKMSRSRSFPSFFNRKKIFAPDARLNGGRRAMIMSGEYDRYLPMDIMAEYLLKAILARDIERMEALGIYEVTPGDFSAAEYADTSKLELQRIVREGLDYMIKEVGTGD